MFKAAFALAFSAFLRVGEITVTQYRNDQNTLKYSDITSDENKRVLYVHVRFSKTDQSGKPTTLIVQKTPEIYMSFILKGKRNAGKHNMLLFF